MSRVCVYTSFGVNCTWISLKFVIRFAISIDPPGLAERLRTCLNQSRTRQEVIALVAVVVTAETTGPSSPPWSELER